MLFLIMMQVAAQQPLNLTCLGNGVANEATVSTVYSNGSAYGSVGNVPVSAYGSGTKNIYGSRQEAFEGQTDVHLFGGDDRIRLPRTLLPTFHGGKDGWFKLKNVVADDRSIRAKASLNFMSNPTVYIDRVTGTISISGKAGDFNGQCHAMTGDDTPKF